MTTFEQELEIAVKHGCPFCDYEEFALKCVEPTWYRITMSDNKIGYEKMDWIEAHHLESRDSNVACDNPDCYAVLWEYGEGWETELHKAIRSVKEGEGDTIRD